MAGTSPATTRDKRFNMTGMRGNGTIGATHGEMPRRGVFCNRFARTLIYATQSTAAEHFGASSVEEHRRTSTSSPTWPRCVNGAIFIGVQIIQMRITRRKRNSPASGAFIRRGVFVLIDPNGSFWFRECRNRIGKNINAHARKVVPPKQIRLVVLTATCGRCCFRTLGSYTVRPGNLSTPV